MKTFTLSSWKNIHVNSSWFWSSWKLLPSVFSLFKTSTLELKYGQFLMVFRLHMVGPKWAQKCNPNRWILGLWMPKMRTKCTPNRRIQGLWMSKMRTKINPKSMDNRAVDVQNAHKMQSKSMDTRSEMRTKACSKSLDTRAVEGNKCTQHALQIDRYRGCGGTQKAHTHALQINGY